MKKLLAYLLAFVLLTAFPLQVQAKEKEKLDFTEAKAVALMCTDNRELLYGENEKAHFSPASVTKIMTILLVLEALDAKEIKLSDTVTASAEAVSMGGSQIWLEVGEQMTVEELFKAVVVASANDACTALAEFVGGSTTAFVKMMNDRAKELGCENTNFENCNGLDDTVKNHYSCAYDLALISCEVMRHPLIKKYTSIWLDSLRGGETELNNTNKLVNTYNGITGLKTGTTSNAGFCIAATAERDGLPLVAVVLGSETSEKRFDTATLLLDWGFANYELMTPETDVKQVHRVSVKNGKIKSIMPTYSADTKVLVKKGTGEISCSYKQKNSVKAPVSKGDKLGEIILSKDGKPVGSIPLTAPKSVEAVTFVYILNNIISSI